MDKVKLSGFNLDEIEMSIVNKVINKYAERIAERMRFDELKLDLKKERHGKAFLHEIKGSLKVGKNLFNSQIADYNLLKAIAEVMNKLIREAEHKIKKEK